MSVSDWVCEEYEALIRAGKTPEEAAKQVKEAAEKNGRRDDLWREYAEMMIQQIFFIGIRQRRQAARRIEVMESVPITVAVMERPEAVPVDVLPADDTTEVPAEFGYRHADPEKVIASIFDGPIYVNKRLTRYGDMTAADWEAKSLEFRTAADNATTRMWACGTIAKRLTAGLTTEQCLSASEFAKMIPAIGF